MTAAERDKIFPQSATSHRISFCNDISKVILLFLAGRETTSKMIVNMLIALHRRPQQQLERLKRDPDLIPKAVLECLRHDGSVQMTIRAVHEDAEVAGVQIPRGTVLFLSSSAANRDPAKFIQPDRQYGEGDEGRVQTFGTGIHHCVRYRLALIEFD